jgi:hypothetical protein
MMTRIQLELKNPENMSIRRVTWNDIRNSVMKANPYVASLIDEIDPGKELPLIEACYPYGVDIHKGGINYFPTNNGFLTTLDDQSIDKEIRDSLNYSSCPLGFIIDKSAEVYVESDERRSIPFKHFSAGITFGVWEIMDPAPIQLRKVWHWNISSGARTVFFLPSVSERNSFNRLKMEFDIKSQVPASIFDQRDIFAEIAQHSSASWSCKVLYFGKEWLNDNSLPLAKLKQHWQKEAWNQAQHWLSRLVLDYSWEKLSNELSARNIKTKPYILDTLKHLVSIGCGTIPGFAPVPINEASLPNRTLEDAYVNIYGLKYYHPIILQPSFLLTTHEEDYVYYSLQYPTLCEKPANFSSFPSVLAMLRELKNTIEIFLDLASKWSKIDSHGINDFYEHVNFRCFHNEKDKYKQIDTTDIIFSEDSRLRHDDKLYGPRIDPDAAHFFRGCVRIGFHKSGSK